MRRQNNRIDSISYSHSARAMIIALALLLLAAAGLVPPGPALASCGGITLVEDGAELSAAINDFNEQDGPCDYTIEFANDIVMSSNLPDIYNEDSGLGLFIDGAGYSLDLNNKAQSFEFYDVSEVVVENLAITNAIGPGIYSSGSNLRVLKTVILNSVEAGINFHDGSLTVIDSTVAANRYHGILSYFVSEDTQTYIINSTITANQGHGISLIESAGVLRNVTVYNNVEYGLHAYLNEVTVHNSILAGHNIGDCYEENGASVAIEYSLVEFDNNCDAASGFGNVTDESPLLGFFGNDGGPTPTLPLLSLTGSITKKSPAIDAGDDEKALDENDEPLEFDQRGVGHDRIVGNSVDMGAYEGEVAVECGNIMNVSNEEELTYAILCFNERTAAGEFHIYITNNITLTAPLPTISNADEDIKLYIHFDGKTLDANQSAPGLVVVNSAEVIISGATIINSLQSGLTVVNNSTVTLYGGNIRQNSSHGIQVANNSTLEMIGVSVVFNGSTGVYVYFSGKLVAVNSTIYGNNGSGVYAHQSVAELRHVTIVGNLSDGLQVESNDAVQVYNSLLADNGTDCSAYNNTLLDIAHTFVGSDSGCDADTSATNIVGGDALVGPLGNYGGGTLTVPLLKFGGILNLASPALDAGSNDLSRDLVGNFLGTDQRGENRQIGPAVDMGAFEGFEEFDCALAMTASDEIELNAAVLCYNKATTPGAYTITLLNDIDLSAAPVSIDNDDSDISLTIDGDDNTIDAQNILNVRPITVEEETTVTLRSMTLTGGNIPDNAGGIRNNGFMTLENVRVEGNSAEAGGGIANDLDAEMTISESEIVANSAAVFEDYGGGGGILNFGRMTINDSLIAENTLQTIFDAKGAGILNYGQLSVYRSTIENNTAEVEDEIALGGGIASYTNLLVRDSTISGNVAKSNNIARGAGIYAVPAPFFAEYNNFAARVLIINSTISSNLLDTGYDAYGSGLYVANSGETGFEYQIPVAIINSTVAGNEATTDEDAAGAGVYLESEAEEDGLDVVINNSILAGNRLDGELSDCFLYGDGPLSFDSQNSLYQSDGGNACNVVDEDDGNIVGEDPLLGPLANNGGPTWTHLPGEGSPAIDAGDDALAVDEEGDDLTADQRGSPRIFGSAVDMGSVEVGAAPAAAVYMSATKSGSISGGPYGTVFYDNSDILMWDGEGWSKVFDGSAAGLFPENKPKHNTNAFWIAGEGEEVIMSFGQNGRKVPGLTTKVDGMDLVRWDGESFSLYFDGSDVGLTQKTPEKIDGLHVLPGSAAPEDFGGSCVAWLLISTQGPAKVPAEGGGQLKVGGEDVLGFCATNLGQDTAGFWRLVVDGSAVGLKKNAVDGLSLSEDGQTLYMTMKKAVNSPVVAGHSMIIAYDLDSETFYGPLFKAADYSLTKKIDGMQVQGTLGD